jgi:hypothetical protein
LSKNFPLNLIFIVLFWYSQESHPAVFSEFVWKQFTNISIVAGWDSLSGWVELSIIGGARSPI